MQCLPAHFVLAGVQPVEDRLEPCIVHLQIAAPPCHDDAMDDRAAEFAVLCTAKVRQIAAPPCHEKRRRICCAVCHQRPSGAGPRCHLQDCVLGGQVERQPALDRHVEAAAPRSRQKYRVGRSCRDVGDNYGLWRVRVGDNYGPTRPRSSRSRRRPGPSQRAARLQKVRV